jgi:hypothetical protein
MTSLCRIVPLFVLLAACGRQDAPAPRETKAAAPEGAQAKAEPGSLKEKRLPPGDPHAMPPPGEEQPVGDAMPSTEGKLDAMIDGKPAHFVRLAPGQNRAITLPGEGVGRVSIAGSEDDAGLPHLRLIVEGVRPDQLAYPITIGSKPKDAAAVKGPWVSIRYEVNENRVYVIDPAKGAEAQVTLEGWEGSKLSGRFEGKLAPTAAALGGPIPISGTFAVTLGLQGVEPGAAGPEPSAAGPTK